MSSLMSLRMSPIRSGCADPAHAGLEGQFGTIPISLGVSQTSSRARSLVPPLAVAREHLARAILVADA